MYGFIRRNAFQFRASLIILIWKIPTALSTVFLPRTADFFYPAATAFVIKRHFARVPRCGRFPPTRLRHSQIGASQGCINVRQCVKSTLICKQPPFLTRPLPPCIPIKYLESSYVPSHFLCIAYSHTVLFKKIKQELFIISNCYKYIYAISLTLFISHLSLNF